MQLEKIGNIARFINGAAFKPEDWEETGYKIIRIQNLTDPSKPFNRTNRKVDEKYIVRKGDVLVSWSATIDVFVWDNEDALLNQHIFKVEFDHKKVTKEYFIVALKKTIGELTKFAHGSTMKHVVKSDFDNHQIPLPSLNEQKHIAEVLSKAEALIAERKQSIQLLDEYLKSTFLEMFGDPVKNEKGWEIKTISSLLKRPSINGHYVPKELYSQNGTEMVHMSDLFYDIVQRGSLKRVDISDKEKTKYELTSNDILIARRSLNPEGAAKACLIPHSNEPLIFESSMIRLTPNIDIILPIYLFYFLNNERAKKHYVLKHITKSTISGINQSNLNKIEVVVPPIKLQIQFAAIVEKTEALKAQYKEHLQSLEQMYGALSQRAFRGGQLSEDGGRSKPEIKRKEEQMVGKLGMAAEPGGKYKKT